jgi:GDP-4-dehydro-6-deoxy-D-mannose reductase
VRGDGDGGASAGWFACDVSDERRVEALLNWAGDVTHIFHLAAITFVPDSGKNPAHTLAVNTLGTIHLAHRLAAQSQKPRLIFIGSAEVYGHPRSLPIEESHPFNPVNPYAISKAAADNFCAWAGDHLGLDIVRMRPFNHSGPGQSDQFVLSAFARQLARIAAGKQPPEVHVGNLDSARDFSHVADIVRGYEAAALYGKRGEAYNICSGRAYTIKHALDVLIRLSGKNVSVVTDPDRMRGVEVTDYWGSHEKLTHDTQWNPSIPLDQTLKDLYEWWRGQERQ